MKHPPGLRAASGWIEYLADRPRADRFASYIEGLEPLLVCAIEVFEVYKVVTSDIDFYGLPGATVIR